MPISDPEKRKAYHRKYEKDHPRKRDQKEYQRKKAAEAGHWPVKDFRKKMVQAAKTRAKKKGIPFDITFEDFTIPRYCPVLGIELKIGGGERYHATDATPSLDRINPRRGYVKGNVIVISMRANRIKNDGDAEEHIKVGNWLSSLKGFFQ